MKNGDKTTCLALIVTIQGSNNTCCSRVTVIVDNIWAKETTRQLEVSKAVFSVVKICAATKRSQGPLSMELRGR